MSIVQKKAPATVTAFVSGAPDAQAKTIKTIKTSGKKQVISVTVSPDLLAEFDAWAVARSMSRAAGIGFAMRMAMDNA
jgi:hypothetical protein